GLGAASPQATLAGAPVGPAREFRTAGDAHIDERTQPDAVLLVDFILSMRRQRRDAAEGNHQREMREAAGHDGSPVRKGRKGLFAPHPLPLPKGSPKNGIR